MNYPTFVKVSKRLILLYRLELNMARDHFFLESEKSRMNCFYPLLSFPDQQHPDYYIFDSQQKTDVDILQKLKDADLYNPSGKEFYHVQKKKRRSKPIPLHSMKSLLSMKGLADNKSLDRK